MGMTKGGEAACSLGHGHRRSSIQRKVADRGVPPDVPGGSVIAGGSLRSQPAILSGWHHQSEGGTGVLV